MKKDEIKIGGTYMAKVTDKVVPVRLDAENSHGGWDATNLVTNKKVRIKSAQRLRGPARRKETPVETKHAPRKEAGSKEPTAKEPKAPKPAKPVKEKKPSLLDSAATVLAKKGQPMRCGDIVETILSAGVWKTSGKTPAATLYSAILREINTKGGESRFAKTDRGLFTASAK